MAQLPHQSERLKPIVWNVFFFPARLLKNEATKSKAQLKKSMAHKKYKYIQITIGWIISQTNCSVQLISVDISCTFHRVKYSSNGHLFGATMLDNNHMKIHPK